MAESVEEFIKRGEEDRTAMTRRNFLKKAIGAAAALSAGFGIGLWGNRGQAEAQKTQPELPYYSASELEVKLKGVKELAPGEIEPAVIRIESALLTGYKKKEEIPYLHEGPHVEFNGQKTKTFGPLPDGASFMALLVVAGEKVAPELAKPYWYAIAGSEILKKCPQIENIDAARAYFVSAAFAKKVNP